MLFYNFCAYAAFQKESLLLVVAILLLLVAMHCLLQLCTVFTLFWACTVYMACNRFCIFSKGHLGLRGAGLCVDFAAHS